MRVPITEGVGETTGWAMTSGLAEISTPEKIPKSTQKTTNEATE
jgi:hypothetical protein